jgi:NTE family protein
MSRPARLGLALGGGFARGIAHVGVLRVLERNGIPVHAVTGVSAGSIVAAAYASGATTEEIAAAGRAMRFADIARWSICRMGFAVSERMARFLGKLLKHSRFENMPIPAGVLATDLVTGEPVPFYGRGDAYLPIRASCAYPGLFRPVEHEGRLLVDGAMSVEVPAVLARALGADRVISVHLPMQNAAAPPRNMFQVVNRCFQIMQRRTEESWRASSDLVLVPDVTGVEWDGFENAATLIEAGERAAEAALDQIRALLQPITGSIPVLPFPARSESSFEEASVHRSVVPAGAGSLGRIRLSESPGSQG